MKLDKVKVNVSFEVEIGEGAEVESIEELLAYLRHKVYKTELSMNSISCRGGDNNLLNHQVSNYESVYALDVNGEDLVISKSTV